MLGRTTVVLFFLLLVWGNLVAGMKAGLGCPDWPLCHGRVLPPLRLDVYMEFMHRVIASAATGFLAVLAFRRLKVYRGVAKAVPVTAAGLVAAEVVIGSAADSVLTEIERVPLPEGVTPSASHRLALECAVTGSGGDRLVVWVDGVLAIDHLTSGSLGAFDRTALYAAADSRRFAASFDDVTIKAGSEYRPVGDVPPVTTQ